MGRQRTRQLKIQPEQEPVSARAPEMVARPSEHSMLHLQRTIGNQAVTHLLQTSQTKRVNGKTANTRLQRALIDGKTQENQLDAFGPDAMDNETYTRLTVALIEYATLMKRNTGTLAGRDDKAKGETFYAEVDAQLTAIGKTSQKFLEHKKHKGLDVTWLKNLVERDIPETQAAARWVQHNLAAYPDSTYLSAMTTANTDRKTKLMDYVRDQSVVSWDQMPDAQKQLLENNRDRDAARVGAIRKQAQTMMEQKAKPREVLAYMAKEAAKFVQDVVKEYVQVAGLEQSDLAVVKTGSFGSGEMFPYSDVDVQIMTSRSGAGAVGVEQMHLILHNIRMRVRLANMQEKAGQWEATEGWDVDQLVGSTDNPAFDPQTAAQTDENKGLAQSSLLYAGTPGGEKLAGDLKGRFTANGPADARAKMDKDLEQEVRTGRWWMKKENGLDDGAEVFSFKDKFMMLPKILLNVVAMNYGLRTSNSWDRVDEAVQRKIFSPDAGKAFKEYLDIVSTIRLKYQFFYEHEGRDTVSPTPDRMPSVSAQAMYPKGYYALTDEDRAALKKAQQIQQNILTRSVEILNENIPYPQNSREL